MTNKARNTAGKFSAKSETPRKVRSVNLTENCWQWLARIAGEAGMSRNDYLEALADGSPPIMETVETKPELDDSVRAALIDAAAAKKTAAIFGFTPDEALADAHFQINMLTSNYDELEDMHEALKREYSVVFPIMETVEATANPIMETDAHIFSKNQEIAELRLQELRLELENESLKKELAEVQEIGSIANGTENEENLRQALEASDAILRSRNQEIAALNARLAGKDEIISEATEQIERLESELATRSQLSDLKQNSAPADLSAKTKAICKLVKPWVSAKYVNTLTAQIKQELEF